jgi:hypothetical protein
MPDYEILSLSVRELFSSGRYVIPVYQRNYAWTAIEVQQLVADIRDCALARKTRSYYLGSLVVFERGENLFETVDGQQRHTTLGILLAVLKNEFNQKLPGVRRINLTFDSRQSSSATLRDLFSDCKSAPGTMYEQNMLLAYRECVRVLREETPEALKKITDYLLDQVKLIRAPVPVDTDLNHYFEVMNNRGEQLAKHEVLKARLMEQLPESQQTAFAAIWDACADMGRYVQLSFPKQLRAKLFGPDWNNCPDKLSLVASVLKSGSQHEESKSLGEIMNAPPSKLLRGETQEISSDAGGVVTFSNFLLHVLRICGAKPRDVPLDDKRLLDTFAEADFAPSPADFIIDLLRCRMLLDRYVVRRQDDGSWGIRTLKFKGGEASKDNVYLKDTFNSEKNQKLVMLLAMFHVSFPAQIYKHWLSAALRFLYKSEINGKITCAAYLERMEEISDRFLFGRFGPGEPIDYYNLCFSRDVDISQTINQANLHLGTSVQNFIFNRLDYLLWCKLSDGDNFAGVDMASVKKGYRKFAFTFRSSVEHHYPQNPEARHKRLIQSPQLPHGCDTFGNLCLISRSNNSKLNNLIPDAKKGHFSESTAVESLKQVFMFTYPEWGPKNEAAIRHHEKMMIGVLCTPTAHRVARRTPTVAAKSRST